MIKNALVKQNRQWYCQACDGKMFVLVLYYVLVQQSIESILRLTSVTVCVCNHRALYYYLWFDWSHLCHMYVQASLIALSCCTFNFIVFNFYQWLTAFQSMAFIWWWLCITTLNYYCVPLLDATTACHMPLLCATTLYYLCVLLLCTITVHYYFVLLLCTTTVCYNYMLLLCTTMLYYYCVLLLCATTVCYNCMLLLCTTMLYYYCVLLLCTTTVY